MLTTTTWAERRQYARGDQRRPHECPRDDRAAAQVVGEGLTGFFGDRSTGSTGLVVRISIAAIFFLQTAGRADDDDDIGDDDRRSTMCRRPTTCAVVWFGWRRAHAAPPPLGQARGTLLLRHCVMVPLRAIYQMANLIFFLALLHVHRGRGMEFFKSLSDFPRPSADETPRHDARRAARAPPVGAVGRAAWRPAAPFSAVPILRGAPALRHHYKIVCPHHHVRRHRGASAASLTA